MGWGNESLFNVPGHMTKMATMPLYGKNLKKSSSLEPKGWWLWKLVCSMGCSCSTKVVQMMTLGWPWPILRQGQIWSLMLLYSINRSETCCLWFETSNRWPKRREVSIDNKTLSPGGCMARGYIHVLNHEKKMYKKQTSKRFLWNLQQMGKLIRPFCWHPNFVPWGLSAHAPGL